MGRRPEPPETGGYNTFRLPGELIKRIDEYLADNEWGYRSRAELVSAAIREFLEKRRPNVAARALSELSEIEKEARARDELRRLHEREKG